MLRLFVLLAALALLPGCGIYSSVRASMRNDDLMKLQVGMSRGDVIRVMGEPQKREMYGNEEYLLYKTANEDFVGESVNYTPVAILDGRVVGWGRNYYDNAVRSKVDANVNVTHR